MERREGMQQCVPSSVGLGCVGSWGEGEEGLGGSGGPASMTLCERLWPCVERVCGVSGCVLCLGAWLSTSKCLMVTLVRLGVYLAPGSDVDHSWLLAGQCVSARGHFRPLGLGLSTQCCLFRAKPPIPPSPPLRCRTSRLQRSLLQAAERLPKQTSPRDL